MVCRIRHFQLFSHCALSSVHAVQPASLVSIDEQCQVECHTNASQSEQYMCGAFTQDRCIMTFSFQVFTVFLYIHVTAWQLLRASRTQLLNISVYAVFCICVLHTLIYTSCFILITSTEALHVPSYDLMHFLQMQSSDCPSRNSTNVIVAHGVVLIAWQSSIMHGWVEWLASTKRTDLSTF